MTLKGELLYEGKAKKIFATAETSENVIQEFKDSLTAFNGEKKAELKGKGEWNAEITSILFKELSDKGIFSHFIEKLDARSILTKKLEMIPLEVVVRNRVAGSLKKRFGLTEGAEISPPLVELYYKDDGLGDPFISDEQALMLKASDLETIQVLKKFALKVNDVLISKFEDCGIDLVDFKLEFGKAIDGQILLGDEITPDTCRLWEKDGTKLDKDRFRFDLGPVEEGYKKVLEQLKN